MTRGTVSTVSTIIVVIYIVGAGRWVAIATSLAFGYAARNN